MKTVNFLSKKKKVSQIFWIFLKRKKPKNWIFFYAVDFLQRIIFMPYDIAVDSLIKKKHFIRTFWNKILNFNFNNNKKLRTFFISNFSHYYSSFYLCLLRLFQFLKPNLPINIWCKWEFFNYHLINKFFKIRSWISQEEKIIFTPTHRRASKAS